MRQYSKRAYGGVSFAMLALCDGCLRFQNQYNKLRVVQFYSEVKLMGIKVVWDDMIFNFSL